MPLSTEKSELDVSACIWNVWKPALQEARGAVAFLDDGACEALRWSGGVGRLIDSGVTAIKEFSAFQAGSSSDTQAVFLLASSNVQSRSTLDVLQSILVASCFERTTVVTAVPLQSTPERTVAQEITFLQRSLREWMGSCDSTISKVVHLPLDLACILPNLVLAPCLAKLFPPLVAEEPEPNSVVLNATKRQLPDDKRALMTQLISSLNLLLSQLSVRDRLFSLGRLAFTVAERLEECEFTATRRGGLAEDSPNACVVLMDRTLDVVGSLSQGCENVLDTMRKVLPAFDTIDVAFDMAPVCYASSVMTSAGYCLSKGSLSCLSLEKRRELYNLKPKLAPLYLRDEFSSLADCCGVRESALTPNDHPVEFVSKNLQVFRGCEQAFEQDNVRSLIAVVGLCDALVCRSAKCLMERLAAEKLFVQSATQSLLSAGFDASDALKHLVEMRGKNNFGFQDLVSFILHISSFCGEELYVDRESREKLREGLLDSLTEETLAPADKWSEVAKTLIPSLTVTEARLQGAVDTVMEAMARVRMTRKDLKSLKRLFRRDGPALPIIYTPLIVQLVQTLKVDIDCPDLDCHSESSRGVLGGIQGGIGFLMGAVGAATGSLASSRASPLEDAGVLIIVLLGGITFTELSQIEETMADTGKQLILFATSLLTPSETVRHVLTSLI